MKFVRAAVALACTAALVSACGGEVEAGPSAQDKYCTEYRAFYDATNAGQDEDDAAVVKRMKSFAAKAAVLDKPSEMGEAASAGLDTWIDLMDQLDENASQQDVVELDKGLGKAEKAEMDAFYGYSNKACLSTNQG